MPDKNDRIAELILKHLQNTLSDQEIEELDQWRMADPSNQAQFEDWNNEDMLMAGLAIYQDGEQKMKPAKVARPYTLFRYRFIAAASIIILFCAGLLYLLNHRHSDGQGSIAVLHDVTAPTGNKTTLTLGDGSIITLDSVTAGQLATQGKTRIDKTSSGQIVYTSLNGKPQSEILVNTLSTGYGGFTKVVLPDGSRVWLNSLSSLRFPNVFAGRDREVELTGEAFFEIEKNTHPFHVHVNGSDIEVLGTHFNINAYANEPAQKTTLLEGAVKVGAGGHSVILSPGQQAEVGSDAVAGSIRVLKSADTDQAIAWVGGNFEFSSDGLESVMHQLERWYNISVKFETKPTVHISGSVSKKRNLSEVLNVLKISGVDYSIEGRTVIIK